MYTLNIPLNTTTWCTYLSILLLQIVDNCTECGSALRSTRVTQDRGRWIRPTSQHGRPLLLNALHFHQQYPHLDLDLQGAPKKFQIEIKMSSRSLLNYFKSEQDQRALSKLRMQSDQSDVQNLAHLDITIVFTTKQIWTFDTCQVNDSTFVCWYLKWTRKALEKRSEVENIANISESIGP